MTNTATVRSIVESDVMPTICAAWFKRATDLGLPKKGAKRDADAEAFMQGAMQALVCAGIITTDRTAQIGFLCAVGRLPEFMKTNADAAKG